MEFIKKRLIIIVSVSAAVIGVILCFTLYLPLAKEIKELGKEVFVLETELSGARENINSMKLIKRNIFLVNGDEVSPVIDELNKLAGSYNINIISMTPKEIKLEGDYQVLPIEIILESKYAELAIFLGALDELQSGVVVVANFEIASDKEESLRLKSNLMLNLYINSTEYPYGQN